MHTFTSVDPTSNSAHCTLNQHLLRTLNSASAIQGLREENIQILNPIAANIETFNAPYLFILICLLPEPATVLITVLFIYTRVSDTRYMVPANYLNLVMAFSYSVISPIKTI